ncbi:MAG: hypothetical protein QNJ56_10245 [Gammaproteobacteria bacterium]|nr:hypothetical protein [Gammaproteobacteria bacterium]
MMQNDIQSEELFLNTLDDLDVTIRKAQLIHKIDLKSREAKNASPEELKHIQMQLKAYREQIRMLDNSD